MYTAPFIIEKARSIGAKLIKREAGNFSSVQTFEMPDTSTFVVVVTASAWFGSFGCGNEIRTQVRLATEGTAKEFAAKFDAD